MLLKLVLSNFRRHRELTVDFTAGIQVLRGSNEFGKTSVLEGLSYALFGSKALRTTLEEACTWGEHVNTLKVTLTMQSGGDTFEFCRGKSGAEATKNGVVFCTGQNEVTSLAATLLGADANTATKLMFASQGNLRGALNEGPKALSQIIEDLAGFSTFDTILEAAQTKLSLGSPSILEERLKGAVATLEAATESLPALPDAEEFKVATAALNNRVSDAKGALPDLELKATSTDHAWRAGSQLYMGRVTLESDVERATETLTRAKAQVDALAPAAATLFTDSRPALRHALAEAEDFEKRSAAYRVFKSLPEGECYSNGLSEFVKDMESCSAEKKRIDAEINQHLLAMEKLGQMRLTEGNCSKCGQPTEHLTHIVETNTRLDAECAALRAKINALQPVLNAEVSREARFKAIRTYANSLQPLYMKLAGYVDFDNSVYPAEAKWNDSIPPDEVPDCAAIRAGISKQDAEIKAIEAAVAKHELAIEQCLKAEAELASATQTLAAYESPSAQDILDLTEAKENASLNFNAAKGEIIIAERELADIKTVFDSAMRLWTMAKARVDDSTAVIVACKKDLGSLAFNNNLVRRLRAIRPVVANRVWAGVLSATSVMFSQMRGEPSIVTKETSGFLVNGQSVASLSGSTLDLLGLALRVSMTRTFIPNSGLLVLDEACAAMDSERTEAMLGFVASAGYQQVLLVTHEEISSSIADNLIQLGE